MRIGLEGSLGLPQRSMCVAFSPLAAYAAAPGESEIRQPSIPSCCNRKTQVANSSRAGLVNDRDFLRRITIDQAGHRIRYHHGDSSSLNLGQPPRRRALVVEKLLEDDRFAERWTVFLVTCSAFARMPKGFSPDRLRLQGHSGRCPLRRVVPAIDCCQRVQGWSHSGSRASFLATTLILQRSQALPRRCSWEFGSLVPNVMQIIPLTSGLANNSTVSQPTSVRLVALRANCLIPFTPPRTLRVRCFGRRKTKLAKILASRWFPASRSI